MVVITSEIKEVFEKPELYDKTKPIVIVELTKDDEDSLPDLMVEDWTKSFIDEINEFQSNHGDKVLEFKIKSSSVLVFNKLRYYFKIKMLSNLMIEVDNVRYDIVFPTGSMDMSYLSDDSQLSIYLKDFTINIL